MKIVSNSSKETDFSQKMQDYLEEEIEVEKLSYLGISLGASESEVRRIFGLPLMNSFSWERGTAEDGYSDMPLGYGGDENHYAAWIWLKDSAVNQIDCHSSGGERPSKPCPAIEGAAIGIPKEELYQRLGSASRQDQVSDNGKRFRLLFGRDGGCITATIDHGRVYALGVADCNQ